MINYEKLFRFASASIASCTKIEETGKFKSTDESKTAFEALTTEEKKLATQFIGDVNSLRWAVKEKLIKKNHQRFYNRLQYQFENEN
jgi:hypothetical protein